jgi:hypothetical protein
MSSLPPRSLPFVVSLHDVSADRNFSRAQLVHQFFFPFNVNLANGWDRKGCLDHENKNRIF